MVATQLERCSPARSISPQKAVSIGAAFYSRVVAQQIEKQTDKKKVALVRKKARENNHENCHG